METKDDLERNRIKRRLRVGCDVLARNSQAPMRTRQLRAGNTVRIRDNADFDDVVTATPT